jgi:hypothetical protein
MSERIETFRDLHLYQSAFKLQQEIFRISKRFPKEELYSLTDQILRSSRSTGANLSEAWKKRRYGRNLSLDPGLDKNIAHVPYGF